MTTRLRIHGHDRLDPTLSACGKGGLPMTDDPLAVTCKQCLSRSSLPVVQNQRLRDLNKANRMRQGYPNREVFIIELNDRPEQYAHAYKSQKLAEIALSHRREKEGLKVQKYVPAKD